MADEAPRFAELVALLAEHGVEFIIVGGVAAVLQGASLTTFDLDVLHRRTPENVDRLLRALARLGAALAIAATPTAAARRATHCTPPPRACGGD